MPTTIRHPDSGQVKFAQDWEVDSYKDVGWVVDESATQDADGVNRNPDSAGGPSNDEDKPAKKTSSRSSKSRAKK